MRKQKWTPDRQAELAALSAQGLSAVRIAKQIGESVSSVDNAMRYYGLYARPKRVRVSLANAGGTHAD